MIAKISQIAAQALNEKIQGDVKLREKYKIKKKRSFSRQMLCHCNFYNTYANVKIRSFPKKLQKSPLKF